MTDEELVKLIRSSPWSDGFPYLSQTADRIERLSAALREIESISVHSDGEIHGVTALRWELAFEQAQGTARDALIGVEHD